MRAGSPSALRVTSHVENLAQSACKRASGDKMWCGTCHDPHTPPEPAAKASYFRSKCLSCHQPRDCGQDIAILDRHREDETADGTGIRSRALYGLAGARFDAWRCDEAVAILDRVLA